MTPRRARTAARCLTLLALSAACLAPGACGALQSRAGGTTASRAELARLNALYARLVDLGDDLIARIEIETDRIKRSTPDLQTRIWAHRLKLSTAQATVRNIAEPNPIVALMDMTTLAVLSHRMLERAGGQVFGPDNSVLLEVFQRTKVDAWALVEEYVPPAEAQRLRAAIDRWERDNPLEFLGVATVRLEDFAAERHVQRTSASEPGSLFALLTFDPLSGLDPAVREIEQTRMLADRAIYQVQRMPKLTRWEAEGLMLDALATPEVQEVLGAVPGVEDSAAMLSQTAADLPALVRAERTTTLAEASEAGRSLLNGLLWRALAVVLAAGLVLYVVLRAARRRV